MATNEGKLERQYQRYNPFLNIEPKLSWIVKPTEQEWFQIFQETGKDLECLVNLSGVLKSA